MKKGGSGGEGGGGKGGAVRAARAFEWLVKRWRWWPEESRTDHAAWSRRRAERVPSAAVTTHQEWEEAARRRCKDLRSHREREALSE